MNKILPLKYYNCILCCLMGSALFNLSACSNPASEMYQKPVEKGQEAVEKARNVQQQVDQTKTTVEQQEKSLGGAPKSP